MISDELLTASAASFDEAEQFLRDAAFHDDDPSRVLVLDALSKVPDDAVRAAAADKMFGFMYSRLSASDQEVTARIKALAPVLARETRLVRRRLLCDVARPRPAPYEHGALADVAIDDDFLAPLSAFENDCNVPVRNAFAFMLTPSLPASNSSFWTWGCLGRLPRDALTISFRPDPLAIQSATNMRVPFFKMFVYGRELDWDRIGALRNEEHLRWQPDDSDSDDVRFTEASWSPRDDGIHVAIEELPMASECDVRAARYLHGIYVPETSTFKHCDGAVRYYEPGELVERRATRLGKAGKAGTRIKLWKVDGTLPRDAWCGLAASFFVWNKDVESYLGA